jgi:hypothetical protein
MDGTSIAMVLLVVSSLAVLVAFGRQRDDANLRALISANSRTCRVVWVTWPGQDFTLICEDGRAFATATLGSPWHVTTAKGRQFVIRKTSNGPPKRLLGVEFVTDYRLSLETDDGSVVSQHEGSLFEPIFAYQGKSYRLVTAHRWFRTTTLVHEVGAGVVGWLRGSRRTTAMLPSEFPGEVAAFLVVLAGEMVVQV